MTPPTFAVRLSKALDICKRFDLQWACETSCANCLRLYWSTLVSATLSIPFLVCSCALCLLKLRVCGRARVCASTYRLGKVVGSLYDDGQQGGEVVLYTNDGTKEQEYCAGLGSCDFETGEVRMHG